VHGEDAPVLADALLVVERRPGDVSRTASATSAITGAASTSPTAASGDVEQALGGREPARLAEAVEKISQLGRRFSTAILPVYSS
jgi:hypothetical protein